MPSLQTVVVALLVPLCTLFALWKLMPAAGRRAIAGALLRLPHLPATLGARLRFHARAASGSGCDGCDHAPAKAAPATPQVRPITFHPRARR